MTEAGRRTTERIDIEALAPLCAAVGVATACGPVVAWLRQRLAGWQAHLEDDGFLFVQPPGARRDQVRVLYVCHLDEVGGLVGPPAEGGAHYAAPIGVGVRLLAASRLVAMDYLDATGETTRPCTASVRRGRGLRAGLWRRVGRIHPSLAGRSGDALLLEGEALESLATVFTFAGSATLAGDTVVGKALDPRLAVYAVCEALLRDADPRVAGLFFLAEESSTCSARKAARFARESLPSLELLVSCDATEAGSVQPCRGDHPVLRICEKSDLMDPHLTLRTHRDLDRLGVAHDLVADAAASKTHWFSWTGPTLSLGIPCRGIHTPEARAAITAVTGMTDVLLALRDLRLSGDAT